MKKNNIFKIEDQRFYKIIFVIIVGLLILIETLAYLTSFSPVRVSGILIIGNQNQAVSVNQRLQIMFNRPMDKKTKDGAAVATKNISIKPETNFTTTWVGNDLFVIFNKNLKSDTQYEVTISKEIKDLYNTYLGVDYHYKFKTVKEHLTYIQKEKNFPNDTIVESDYDFTNKQNLISLPNIKFYGLNSKYVVAVNEIDQFDNITILNRLTNQTISLNLSSKKIISFDFSPTNNEFSYTKQDVYLENNIAIPKLGSYNSIYIYNIDTNSEKSFNPKGTATDIQEVRYYPDGNSLIYKNGDSYYYIARIDGGSEPILMGKFLQLGSFSGDQTKIVFTNYDPLNTYTSNAFIAVFDSTTRKTTQLTDGTAQILDPNYLNNTDNIIFSSFYSNLDNTKGLYSLSNLDLKKNTSVIVKVNDVSLELPKPSFDDSYIVMEEYTQNNLLDLNNQRNLGSQTKPEYANLVVYDVKNKNIIDKNIKGVDAKWLK